MKSRRQLVPVFNVIKAELLQRRTDLKTLDSACVGRTRQLNKGGSGRSQCQRGKRFLKALRYCMVHLVPKPTKDLRPLISVLLVWLMAAKVVGWLSCTACGTPRCVPKFKMLVMVRIPRFYRSSLVYACRVKMKFAVWLHLLRLHLCCLAV
jgi:hypothetical protein